MSVLFIFAVALLSATYGEIPSYIHVCKRNDPQLNQCILKSVQALRPKLEKGIPELDVPPIEPLNLTDVVLQHGGPMVQLQGSDYVLRGVSKFQLIDFKANIADLIFGVKLNFPKIVINSHYQVQGKFLGLLLQGDGPAEVTAENVEGNLMFKGKKVTKNGKQYLSMDSIDLKLNLKNYEVKLSDGFFKEAAVTNAINGFLRENKKDIIAMIKPKVQTIVKSLLRRNANKITEHFTFDELFPEK